MRTRTRDFKFYLFNSKYQHKPLVFPNKFIHVGSCPAHYVVILAILPFVLFAIAIRFFYFSLSHIHTEKERERERRSYSIYRSLQLLLLWLQFVHFFSHRFASALLTSPVIIVFFCVKHIKRSCHTLRFLNDAINNKL